MNKLFLVGGDSLKKYTIADILWKIINKYSNDKFDFEILEFGSSDRLHEFVKVFNDDPEYCGFNVALPWKEEVAQMIGKFDFDSGNNPIINTVYKHSGELLCSNTDILGIVNGLKINNINIGQINNILILGMGGAGSATARYLKSLGKHVTGYDIKDKNISLGDISGNFDLIINATPVGKYYLDTKPTEFLLPVPVGVLKQISHQNTIYQEMNYFPAKTQFLQVGEYLGLRTIPGYYMLVLQAIESYAKYFKNSLSKDQIDGIISEISLFVQQKEKEIFALV